MLFLFGRGEGVVGLALLGKGQVRQQTCLHFETPGDGCYVYIFLSKF